nr:retrotransposon protein, putative, unclassified [Tanacetum cinerariifolium]
MDAPVLKLPNFEKDFMVRTGASREGIWAALQQRGHLVAYLSKPLSPKHKLLSTYKKESLVVLHALDRWKGLDHLCHLAILCLDQHAHTLHHLESLLTISLDRLDILKEDLCISEFAKVFVFDS